jgi:hypothetical protein
MLSGQLADGFATIFVGELVWAKIEQHYSIAISFWYNIILIVSLVDSRLVTSSDSSVWCFLGSISRTEETTSSQTRRSSWLFLPSMFISVPAVSHIHWTALIVLTDMGTVPLTIYHSGPYHRGRSLYVHYRVVIWGF